jgi:two-component system cell cycle response regulator DivK
MAARILLIEDNNANLELFDYLLGHAGHVILSAIDGGEGIRMAREQRPDLILCDLQMPVFNGYEVLEQIKADPRLSATPVVALTAFSMPGDRNKAIDAGFAGYITKPIEPEAFVRQIEDFLPPGLRVAGPPGGN